MDILRSNELSRNIFPGFVMALINLPMSIGFAFLAGVPPVMMIISSIVCAIVLSHVNSYCHWTIGIDTDAPKAVSCPLVSELLAVVSVSKM